MSVLIKGMKMPNSCKECALAKNYSEWIIDGCYDCKCGITNTKVMKQKKTHDQTGVYWLE